MKDVATGGRTVLFVSHNMAAIRQLTENCLVLSQGRKVFHGKTEEAAIYYSKLCVTRADALSVRASKFPSRIINIQLTKSDGSELNPYKPGEPIRLEVEIEKDASPALSVDFFCKSHLGENLAFGSFHFFHGKRLPAKAGRYLCRIDLEGLNLASGEYGVEARLTVPFERYEDTMELPAAIQVAFCNPAGGAGDLTVGMNLGYLAWISKKEPSIEKR